MDVTSRAALADIAALDAAQAVRCLAAAERAVEEGRMNVAKVLRAAALASRTRALALERLIGAGDPTSPLLTKLADADARAIQALRSGLDAAGDARDGAAARTFGALLDATANRSAVLAASLGSLDTHRDVQEADVAPFLWGCQECGAIFEQARPDLCPACGAIAGEFELFAPFYSATAERMSRHAPADIIAMLRGDAAALSDAMARVPDAAFGTRAAPGEWCAAEIAGHMVDIAGIFCRRLRVALDPAADVPPERSPMPWKLMENQGYESLTRAELLARFSASIDEALGLIGTLQDADWRRSVDMVSGRVRMIDMASWLANHNLSHRQQIVAAAEATP